MPVTSRPRTTEPTINIALAQVLRGKHPLWREHLGTEQTGVFRDRPGLKPDILIQTPGTQPIVLETEFAPARSVEQDAKGRLGLILTDAGDPVEQAIAIRVPSDLRQGQEDLVDRVAAAEYGYCLFYGDAEEPCRWPTAGWLTGSVDDMVRCIEHAMLAQRLIAESLEVFEQGVSSATREIRDARALGFGDMEVNFGQVLNQEPGEQTNRMAMTILANALTFHAVIAGTHGIPTVADIRRKSGGHLQQPLLDCWDHILGEINYWPVFNVASDLLAPIRIPTAKRVLDVLTAAASRLAELGVTSRHDLAGRMFQTLITDRKFLATFYTLPTSAALLAEIAVRQMDVDWADRAGYPKLRVADFSCGTGTLLSAAYQSLLVRYRRAGGDDSQVHRAMIENAMIAADIMPAATHLCASQLSSAHPTVTFGRTRVYTMPYGVDGASGISLGSLDLIGRSATMTLFTTGQRQIGGSGDVENRDIEVPAGSVDLVIMNPPFTRPTNHEATDVPVPAFAGFATGQAEQKAMSRLLRRIRTTLKKAGHRPAGHGNAGLASNFVDLAHMKVRPGGVIAFVLPLSSVQGAAWQATRALLADHYGNIAVVAIATSGNTERAFSADTGMAEALVVATRRRPGSPADPDVLFVNLLRRPETLIEAAEVARLTTRTATAATGGAIMAGEQRLGSFCRAPMTEGGCAAVAETSLIATMLAMQEGRLRLARHPDEHSLDMVELGQLGQRGLLHRDISSSRSEGRGAFTLMPMEGAPAYPVLWSHEATRERRLIVQPDRRAEPRSGRETEAATAWRTATRLHLTLDFQLNSQSLAACLTPERTLGGRAWPNFRLQQVDWEKPVALWANSTLGLLGFWWRGTRQHQGRTVLTISELPGLRVPDPRSLSEGGMARAVDIFREFECRQFLPANEAWRDETRQALDRAVLVDLWRLPEELLEPLAFLRHQWCSEPSVHGGKSTAPPVEDPSST